MNKKRLFIFTALILTVCLIFTMFAAGCDKDENNGNDNNDSSDLLFNNGTFAQTGDDSTLSTPNSWTGAAGSTSSSSTTATPSSDKDLTKGVVSSATSAWKALTKKHSDISISSPGRGPSSQNNKELDDQNILMIHNKTATSYKYTSSSHSIDTESYYKLSVDVKTLLGSDNTDALAGAYIYVNGAAYAGWEAIDTKGEWKTYTLYIETSELSSGSITVVLSLGIGNKQTGHMTKGYVFFDNVVLEKISEVDEDDKDAKAYTKADFDKESVTETVAKYSMRLADREFDYASSTTSIPYSPSKYSVVAGYGSGESASTSSTYTAKGIIDTTTFENAASSLNYLANSLPSGMTLKDLDVPEGSIGSRMLYMQNKQATAFGYRANVQMNFKRNSYYEVSLYARTFLKSGHASIRLTDGTNTDSNNFIIDNIDTDGKWQKFTFYIAANQFRSSELYLEMWLGFGGQNDKETHAEGAVLFDSVTLADSTKEKYEASKSSAEKAIDLRTSEKNMTAVNLADFAIQDEKNAIKDRSVFKILDTDNFVADDYFKENPKKPVEIENTDIINAKALAINNYSPASTVLSTLTVDKDGNVDTSKLINIAPNKAYAISMYVKTVGVDKNMGIGISLLKYNEDYKTDSKKFEDAYTSVSSFTNLNTENLESYKSDNDYTLVTFYVLGAQIKNTRLGISVSLGTGTGSDYSTLTMGYAYVSSMYIENIAYSQYTSAASSTVVNTVALSDSANTSEVSSNGYFNYTDISATNKLFGAEIIDKDGNMKDALALPTNWTPNNNSIISTEAPFNNLAGILNLNNASQLAHFSNIVKDSFYDGAEKFFSVEKNPNVLAIKKDDTVPLLGFTSNSISLSAKSYYAFRIWAKAEANSEFSIVLKTATASDENYKFANLTGDGKWHSYTIFVETGISSTSVTLALNAGNESVSASSTVYFTSATYSSVDAETFKKAQSASSNNDLLTQSWLVDSFDDVDDAESIFTAKNFKGALIDSDASSDEDTLVSGVIDQNKTDFSDIDLNPDDENDEAILNAVFDNSQTNVGDKALVIYNKDATAYGYTSNSATIEAGKYYKISIWILTYKLAAKGENLDENFKPSATITLKANNKTYEFGRRLKSSSTDYEKKRIVNTSTYKDGKEQIGKWTEYSFYILAEEDITDTTATLTVSLGYKGDESKDSDYYMTGYVFVDNFSVEEIQADQFIEREEVYKESEEGNYYKDGDKYVEITSTTPAPDKAPLYKKLTDSEVAKDNNELNSILKDSEAVKNNHRIVFTADDSKEEPEDEEKPNDDKQKDPLIWLYVVSGVVSGAIVLIVVIYLIKKYAPKRKKKLVKTNKKSSPAAKKTVSKRDQFGK